MVQRKQTSGAARCRGRLGVSGGPGGSGAAQSLRAATGRDAASASRSMQAETSSVARRRDVIRSVMPFAGVSVITNGKLCLSTTSDVDAGAASGYHLLVVEGYSQTKEMVSNGKHIMSRPFVVGGHRWCISYAPNGDSSYSADCVSLHLVLLDDDVAKAVKVRFGFSFIDQVEWQNPIYIRETQTHSFSSHDSIRGFDDAVRKDALEQSKHLKGDSFTIRCGVMVYRDLDTVDAGATEVPLPDIQQHLNRLFETKVGADVTFNVSGETIAAHRCVLAARSPVFMAQLFGPMKEGAATCDIQIEDMEANVFRAMLSFIYTDSFPEMENDEAEVEEEQEVDEVLYATWMQWMQDLLVAADRYDIQRLKFCCEEGLSECMDVSSVTSTLVIAEKHHCQYLKEACLNFLRVSPSSLQEVMATSDWEHITVTYPSVLNELIAMLASKA
ncbi:unnamed protein product [Triticum turgidum subsp. durum]|uniref:Uncharacterized protein n=1 Tax=Triticum turgidum subsp. durum TaxID=4567 RepID=A0A9R0QPK4_TRITD|nr:unnamed protein product [Triticum turgidum subsp. durum]